MNGPLFLVCLIILFREICARHSKAVEKSRWTRSTVARTDPTPEPYPACFSIRFATNFTEENSQSTIENHLYYDWSLMSQRVDHGAGSYECYHFYKTNKPCSLLFNEKGMYRIIDMNSSNQSSDGNQDCCLDLPDVGAPPPDWASRANGTFTGMVLDDFSGMLAYRWVFDHLETRQSQQLHAVSNFHTTSQVAEGYYGGLPLTFGFPGNPYQDYHYDVATLTTDKMPPSLFEIPSGCEEHRCESRSRTSEIS